MGTAKSWVGFRTICVLFCWAVSPAGAAVIPLGGGWQASLDQNVTIVVDAVTPDYLLIQISKDFTDGPGVGGVFPGKLIDFVQVADDADTVPQIVIGDESVTNLTGVDWTDYHWALLNDGDAWFDVPLSSGFDTTPFANKTWLDTSGFGDPDKATDLWVDDFPPGGDGDVVPHLGSFFPGAGPGNGELVIGVDLSTAPPVSFTLKQFPAPEPVSLAVVGLVGLTMICRRRSRASVTRDAADTGTHRRS